MVNTRFFGSTADAETLTGSNAGASYFGGQNVGGGEYNYSSHFNQAIAQSWLNRMLIQPLEQNLVFSRYGRMESIQNGYLTHTWARPEKILHTAITRITENGLNSDTTKIGQSPPVLPYRIAMTSATPEQWVLGIGVADMIQQFNVIDYINTAFAQIGMAFARLFDSWIQDRLYAFASGTNLSISHSGNSTPATDVNTFVTANKADSYLKLKDVRRLATTLENRSVPRYGIGGEGGMGADAGGTYVLIVHTNVKHDLLDDDASNQLIDIFKNTPETIQRLIRGYVGTYNGVSVVSSNFVQTKTSTGTGTPTVYPSYALGRGAFGVLKYRYTGRIVSFDQVDTVDYAGQRAIASVNAIFEAKVLDPACLQVNLSTSSMD